MLLEMSRWLIALVFGCGPPPVAPLPPLTQPAEATIAMTPDAIGPLGAASAANLLALRKAFVGYDVTPFNIETAITNPDTGLTVEEIGGVAYHVYDGDKRLFEVVPDQDGKILNVFVDTPKVVVRGKPWRVGAKLEGGVGTCECWGNKPVCFNKGEHVAVSFTRGCRDRIPSKRAFDGKQIARLVWSPKPFGDGDDGGEDYGGEYPDP
jgi:hypothetical protein